MRASGSEVCNSRPARHYVSFSQFISLRGSLHRRRLNLASELVSKAPNPAVRWLGNRYIECRAESRTNRPTDAAHSRFRDVVRQAGTLLLAACVACMPANSAAATLLELPSTDVSRERYERAIRQHSPKSSLPNPGEAEMLLQLDKELFTEDAWEGMKT